MNAFGSFNEYTINPRSVFLGGFERDDVVTVSGHDGSCVAEAR